MGDGDKGTRGQGEGKSVTTELIVNCPLSLPTFTSILIDVVASIACSVVANVGKGNMPIP